MKHCTICERDKPPEEFYRNRSRRDGRAVWCIVCVKAQQHTPHARAVNAASSRRWRATPYGKERYRIYVMTKKNKAARKRANANYAASYPERCKARAAVYKAIKAGKLPGVDTCACVDCGDPAVNHHHENYAPDRRLDVEPLCQQCHTARHRRTEAA